MPSHSTTGASPGFATGNYSYDGVGNIVAIGTDSYAYDSRSRLTSATLSGVGSQAFTYDRYGNLLTKTGTPGNTTFCSGTCANNQVTGGSFLRGNLTSYGGQTFGYDGLDRMTSSTQTSLTWSYLYDSSDERVTKIPPTGSWTYTIRGETKRVASEFSATTPSRDNIFLGNQLVASYANGGVGGSGPVWVFYASDHLGTPRLLTDVAGNVPEPQRRYWPYGEAVTTQGSAEVLRFATMEFDAEGGTSPGLASDRYYDHARSHVGGLGRFLGPDKIEGDSEEPQSWNRYAYAYNNPLRHVDPNGQDAWDVLAGFANAVGSNFTGGGRQPAYNSDVQTGQTLGDLISIPLGGLETLTGAATFTGGLGADATVVGAPVGIALNVVGAAAVSQGVLGAASGALHLAEAKQPGLGNPFKDKAAEQADQMMRDKGFRAVGKNPQAGEGGYVNPNTGRSYHIDPGGKKYRAGVEKPHVDVNRLKPFKKLLPKKKLPLKEPVDN